MLNEDNQVIVYYEPEEDMDRYTEEEVNAYIERGQKKYGSRLRGITLKSVEGDDTLVDIHYDITPVPFTRLRRITGYLVGDMNRWNNAKRAEEGDRVKHGIEE